MYLKQIKAYGFKSFADKINIELCPNINGIVGPNGSGKSNVVDAVRWVLGEQSMKSLRGDNSLDIIFSGSKSRKPLNSATVSLIFDNSDRTVPIDYNEVSIKRTVYRSGENEYFINNERCRLKDIIELLTDSGGSKESFNIISQGKIDEIILAKPLDRRVMFEEAAGVLKYKRRKEEAIRKLERTNLNLNRINDIILELETNLNTLKKQSEEAAIYLDTKDKLKEVEVALMAKDIESLNYEYKESKNKIDELNDEIIKLSGNSSNYDVDILKEKNKLKSIEDKLNLKQSEYIIKTKELEKVDADIRVFKERNKYVTVEDDITNKLFNLKEEELKQNSLINNINNEINLIDKKIEVINTDIERNLEKYNTFKSNKNDINNKLISNNRELVNLNYKIEYLENNINNNSSVPNSIKNIISNPKFSGIHNVIGKLIEVDDEYSIAISTALGGASSYLVVDNTNIAKELVNYLKENKLGRATFFPLNVITGRSISSDVREIINGIEGVIGTADKLVTYNKIYENIITNQLGNVIVTDNIDTANIVSEKINKRYRIVTLDGQVVNVGGSITGGSTISNNIIKEKYELEKFKKEYFTIESKNKELSVELQELDNKINELETKIYNYRLENSNNNENKNSKLNLLEELKEKHNDIVKEINDLKDITSDSVSIKQKSLLDEYYGIKDIIDTIEKEISSLKIDKEKCESDILELEETNKKSNSIISKMEKEVNNLEIKINRIDVKLDNLLLNLNEEYNITFEYAKENFEIDMEEDVARNLVSELKGKLKQIGEVNISSIEEYKRVSERYNFLNNQRNDLKNAEDTLLEIINEMDSIMVEKFSTTFEEIRKEFKVVFKELFKGGNAELVLTDPNNMLETGIDIKAEPPGKHLQNITLLSGGEKTFTAISLLFAILNVRPVPFCLLDEVEAALDDANVESFGNYLYKYKDETQFILITHKKKTMEFADVLYGITMQESGVSKLVSVKLEDVKDYKG